MPILVSSASRWAGPGPMTPPGVKATGVGKCGWRGSHQPGTSRPRASAPSPLQTTAVMSG